MQNEHHGYSFTAGLRRQKKADAAKKKLLAMALIAVLGGIGYWLGNLGGAVIGAVVGYAGGCIFGSTHFFNTKESGDDC